MSNLKKHLDKKGNPSAAHLYIDAKSGIFYAVINVNKKVEKESLETKNYIEAIGKLPAALARLTTADPEKQKAAKAKLAPQLCRDFWEKGVIKEKIAEEVKPQTLVRIKSVWKNNLEPYWGNLRPADIKPDMIPEFMDWHREKRPGKQFYNTFKYLGNLLNYMHRVGAIRIEQMPKLVLPKTEIRHHNKVKTRIITLEEKNELVRSAKLIRTKLLIENDYVLGMRKMELASIEKTQIKKEDGRYFYVLDTDDTKTGLARIIPVPLYINPLLEAQLKESGDSIYLFPNTLGTNHISSQRLDDDWNEAKKDAKIVGSLRFHDLRGTAATNMARNKWNPIIAVTILGMSFATYQKKYLKLSGKDLMMEVDRGTSQESP
jgi:integrase